MITALSVFQGIVSILLIILVLLQFGRGAELGATMGAGSSQSVFTSSQSGNIFTKVTTVLALLFLANSVVMSVLISKRSKSSLFDNVAPISAPLNSDSAKQAPAPLNNDGKNEANAQAPMKATSASTTSAAAPVASPASGK